MILEALFLLTFGVGDVATTLYGLKLGISELNPIVKYLLQNFGFGGFIFYKVFAITYIFLYAPNILLLPVALSLLVVVNNLIIIRKIKVKIQP